MENKSHAMAAGLFVLVVSALLAGLALWLTRDTHQYAEYELSTKDAISGLQPQATVRYKGVAVGKVTRIGFDPQSSGNVLIRIAVVSEAPVSERSTYAQLGYQGVTGIAHVQLDDAERPQMPLPPGPSGLPRLPLRSSPLNQLMDQGPELLGRVDEVTRRLTELLGEPNQQRFAAALDSIAKAAAGAEQLTRSLNATLNERIDPAAAQLPALTQEARQALRSLDEFSRQAAGAAGEVRNLAQRLQTPEGAMSQVEQGAQSLSQAADRLGRTTLPELSRAAGDISRAARQVGQAANRLSDNPQSLLFGPGERTPGPGEPGFSAPAAPAP